MNQYNIAIIGGGPAGYVAAERAAAKGLKVVLFEKRELGGVCLNEGCIPTKTLLYSAKTYENALHADKYGVKTEGVGFDFSRIVARKNKVVRKLVLGVAAKMKNHEVEVVRETATIVGRMTDGRIEIEATGTRYIADNLVICTGAEAFVPPIPGIAEAAANPETADVVMTNREILALKEQPKSLVIVGGGVVGMEFASFFNSIGTTVTVVEQLGEILGANDPEISELVRAHYTKKGITFHLLCKVTRVDVKDSTTAIVRFLDIDGAQHEVEAEKVLVSVGRRPVVKGYGLENLGVTLDERGGIKTDERMRTNIPNVYAAGDVTGFSMLAHTASREAEVAVNNIANISDTMRYEAVPGVVYTNPEVASVGLTYDAARAKGLSVRELRLPMSYSGRFVAENEGGEGLCKVVVVAPPEFEDDATAQNRSLKEGQVVGVHAVGNPASEMIWGACLAIEQGMTAAELERIIFPHPTVSEIVKEVLFT
jgi:dihydrolipoamide dehydrogenase